MTQDYKEIKLAVIDDNKEDAEGSKEVIEINSKKYGYKADAKVIELKREITEDDDYLSVSKIMEILEDHFQDSKLGAIVIDFILATELARYGSSLALRLREGIEDSDEPAMKSLAFIGISSTKPDEESRTELRELEFIDILDRNKLDEHTEEIIALSKGYSKVYNSVDDEFNREKFCNLLGIDRAENLLWNAIPEDFKKDWDADSPHLFSRWVWKELLRTPGFLINKLYASTLLGLTPKAFEKIEEKLDEAKYKGMFAIKSKPLWWQDKLIKVVTSIVETGKLMPIWKRGRKLASFEEDDFARCAITNELNVKLVPAYRGDDKKELVPITFNLTQEDPNESVSAGFEPDRIFRSEN